MMWFDMTNSELAVKHRNAYHKSLSSSHPIKVHAGMYYYKGYEVNTEEGRARDYMWGYRTPGDINMDFCKTKKECIYNIDCGLSEW